MLIDAYALVHKHQYLQALEAIIKQVLAIASLTHLHDRYYPFVIILTKCDALDSGQLQQIQPIVRSLNARLDAVRANYQTFYSQIPLQRAFKTSNLRPIGAAIPLLQLVWDLSQPYHPSWRQDLHQLIVNLRFNSFQLLQAWVVQALPISSRVTNQAIIQLQRLYRLYLLPTDCIREKTLVLALAIVAIVGLMGLASS